MADKPGAVSPAGKAIVITGASTGIGATCAVRLAGMGFEVWAGVRKDEDGVALQQQAGSNIHPLLLDVTDPAQIEQARETVAAAVSAKGLAGLVNNAGISVAGPLEFVPVEQLRRQLEINVIGPVAVSQAFIGLLRQGGGRIVNMGSISGRSALPMLGPYAASKFALEALTDALRLELRTWNIDVSIIEPGDIATPIWKKSLDEGNRMLETLPPETDQLYGPLIRLMQRIGGSSGRRRLSPEKVADVVVHALTAPKPKTRYVVGRTAKIQAFLEMLPDTWRDRVIAGQLSKLR